MMRINRRLLSALGAAALCSAAASSANAQCVGYTVSNGPATFIAGTADSGNHADDGTTAITFPFLVSLYGVSYGGGNVSSNGNLQFTSAAGAFGNNCLPSATFAGPAICAFWDDLYTTDVGGGQGVFTSVSGVSPNQVFSIEWRAQNCCAAGAPIHNFCILLYESNSFFDIVYQTVGAGNAATSTIGVQAAAGGPATQYICNGVGSPAPVAGTSLRFTCQTIAPSGTCCLAGACTFVTQLNCAAPGVWTTGGTCSPNPCPQPGAGDVCATAQTISGPGSPAASGNNSTASDDVQLPCGLNGPANSHKDTWWSFNTGAGGGGDYEISTCGSAFDTILAVYDDCTNLGVLACNDDSCGLQSKVTISLADSTTYKIAVAAWGAAPAGGNYVINIVRLGSGACCNNTTGECSITATNGCTGGTYQGDNSACTPTICPTGACCENLTGICSIGGTACATGSTYQGAGTTCLPATCVTGACCNNTTGDCVPSGTACAAGSTYQGAGSVCSPWPCNGACCDSTTGGCTVTAGGPCAGGTTFVAGGTCTPNACPQPLANDNCGTATTVTVGAPAASGNNTLALSEGVTVACGFNSGKDVWYSFNAGPSGGVFQIDTNGSTYDTVLALFDGCPGLELACDDDGGNGLQSLLTTTLGANEIIKIRLAGYNGATGDFVLNISLLGSGACCNNTTGVCAITPSNTCTGVYGGNDSVCEASPCGTGACCTAGNCTVAIGSDCVAGGGTFQGHGISCGGPFLTRVANNNAFVDISATGTLVAVASACDDCGETVPLPFLFSYLGVSFSDVGVASNGYLQFGGTTSFLGNVPIPNAATPNNILAPLWDDLNPGTAGDIFTLAEGASPNQTFTISWQNVPQFNNTDSNSFQVVLHENGQVEFRYGTITPEGVAGDYTVGFEDANGIAGLNIPGTDLGAGSISLSLNPTTLASPCSISTSGACCCGASCTITTANACTGTGRAFVGGGACAPFSYTSPCCRGDVNKVNNVSVQDIFDYLTLYFGNDPCADTNGVNNVSVQDIFDYLTAYFGGPC